MRKLLPFLIFLFSFTVNAQIKNDPLQLKEYTLKNGLKVFITENHESPRVFGAVVVKAGGKNDPAESTGMAHYLEHMLFKGTTRMGTINYEKEKPFLDSITALYQELGNTTDKIKRLKIQKEINRISIAAAEFAIANEMDKMLAEIGSEDVNAFTTEEVTAYFNSFPSNQLEKWLDLYAHRFNEPVFRLFQSELETVYEEKNRGMDSPLEYVFEEYQKHFYKVHPYGQQTVIGKTEHLKNPSLANMYAYFDKYYVANNMALIISGDVNAEKTFELIEEKFSSWRSKDVDPFPVYQEKEFNGREFFKLRATPVKAGVIGYRIPCYTHPDKITMDIIAALLSNKEGSGLLDQLAKEGKIMQGGLFNMVNKDYGAAYLYFIPKLVGQRLKKAEKIILQPIERIKRGDFDDEFFEATKRSLVKEFEESVESNEERAFMIGFSFLYGIPWNEVINIPEKILSVTKEDIIRVAQNYFADNKLVMYSKMGFPKKDKLEKPPFEPIIPKNDSHSDYYEEWKKIPSKDPQPRFVDLNKDISIQKERSFTLYHTNNPFNSIFRMSIRFGTGKYYDPYLKFIPAYLELAASEKYSATAFRKELQKLGCSVSFNVRDHEWVVVLEGMEDQLGKAIALTSVHLHEILPQEEKLKKIHDDLKTSLRISKRSPEYFAGALNNYVQYGNESPFLREISLEEMKKIKVDSLIRVFKHALSYEAKISYSGKTPATEVSKILSENFAFAEQATPARPRKFYQRVLPTENTVFFYNYPRARQTQVYFLLNPGKFDKDEKPLIDAFNKYFGGDMSSLVFQEIREFRSLAYSTWASLSRGPKKEIDGIFFGYVGCQSDKTIEAITVMNDLIRSLPEKRERWNGIQQSLIQTANSSRPDFRSLPEKVEIWKEFGWDTDPEEFAAAKFPNMNFDQLLQLHKERIKDQPISILVVGSEKSIDLKKLEKFGKITKVKEQEIIKK